MDTWSRGAHNATVAEVLEACGRYAADADGVTITGGEPSEQPEALAAILSGLSEILRPDVDILLYSGKTLDDLAPLLRVLDGQVDALISEPYVEQERQTRPLMGSDNQRLSLLTPLGEARFGLYARQRNSQDDTLDFLSDEEGRIWLAGIPRRGDLERLREIVAEDGVRIRTSEQRPR